MTGAAPAQRSAPPHARAWWARLLPGVDVLLHYDRSWLRGDLLAGLTVSAYLVPQVMAYAEVAGVRAVSGLWAVGPALLVYAILGSSRQLSVGPESTTALMTAAGVGAIVATAGPERHREVAALMAVAVGVLCLVAWVTRLGFLAGLLSKPVLVGYMAGIAALMVVSQLGKVTGLRIEGDSFLSELASAASQLGAAHAPTVALALVVLAALFAFHHWAPTWPGPLIAMLASAALVSWLGLDSDGIQVVGEVPQGFPPVVVPRLDVDLWTLLPAALGVAAVGYSDNVLTGRSFADRKQQRIDSNQEFLALGGANIAAGLVQGFPVSSSASRTVLGDAMGSRTQLHSLVSLVLVIATLLWLGPLLGAFPMAALGAVVVYAAVRLVDVAELRRIAAFRRSELVLALITTASVIVLGVLPGIGVAVVMSVLDLVRRIVHPHDGILGYVPGVAGMHDIDDYANAIQVPGLVVYRYDSPIFFANCNDFRSRALAAVDAAESRRPVRWFLLNAEANTEIDLTAVDTLDSLRLALKDRGIGFAMARVKQDMRDSLAAAGFIDKVGPEHIFPTLPTAVSAYAAWYESEYGTPPPGLKIPPVTPQPPGTGLGSD
jgi:SulP family sulfate permease